MCEIIDKQLGILNQVVHDMFEEGHRDSDSSGYYSKILDVRSELNELNERYNKE